VGKSTNHSESGTRRQLFDASLKSFLNHGYAAPAAQEIVEAAWASKPVLHDYFDHKARLSPN